MKQLQRLLRKKTTETQTADIQPVKTRSVGMEALIIRRKKALGNFNLENKINKIKIPIPLVELAKNTIYQKQIAKMISFSKDESKPMSST
jgi:hypothetical protein